MTIENYVADVTFVDADTRETHRCTVRVRAQFTDATPFTEICDEMEDAAHTEAAKRRPDVDWEVEDTICPEAC